MLDPHRDRPVFRAGVPLDEAKAAVILLHGRGAGAEDILGLAAHLSRDGVAFLAPDAAGRVWYPQPFMAPLAGNEPWLTSALGFIDRLVGIAAQAGVTRDRLVLAGFSQGACLASEYAARQGGRFGAVAALSGGVIGPVVEAARYSASLEGTPAFFGCSDVDPFIPVERVRESAALYRTLGAEVSERIYPRMGHTVNEDEMAWVLEALTAIL